MHIDMIKIFKIMLPYKDEFSISQIKGFSTTLIVVELVADKGELEGYGEGVPIEFVTSETPEGTIENITRFSRMNTFPWELNHLGQIWDFVDSLPSDKENSSAVSALESALLDILGKAENSAVIDYFPSDFITDTVQYGATIPLGSSERISEFCETIKRMKINILRIKMGKDLAQNEQTFRIVRSYFGTDCDIRIDPNHIWDYDLAMKHLQLIKEYKVRVVEEPVSRDEPRFKEFVDSVNSTGAILMACESAPTLNEVKNIVNEGYYKMINVKVCRSGGLRRALKTVDFLRQKGWLFQVGCSLGESGVLSAAGRVLCLLCGDAVYFDGSYDSFLLAENTVLEDVTFGVGGQAGPLKGPGLGIRVSAERLERLSNTSPLTILYKS